MWFGTFELKYAMAIKYLQFFIIIYYRKWTILFLFEVPSVGKSQRVCN